MSGMETLPKEGGDRANRESWPWLSRLSDSKIALFFLVIGAATRLFRIEEPAQVVFDETHFGGFMNHYCCSGFRFFDIHPPLGKLILAGWSQLFGYNGTYAFKEIMEPYEGNTYIALRVLPALFGAVLVPIMYLTARELGISKASSFVAGIMVALEPATLIEQRLILTDSFLLFFCHASFYAFLRVQNAEAGSKTWKQWIAISGLLFAFSLSTKWVAALATYGMCGVVTAWGCLCKVLKRDWATLVQEVKYKLASWVGVPLVVYAACFWIHWQLVSERGKDDEDAFMTPDFREKPFLTRVVELNHRMYTASAYLDATHHWHSGFWSWPLMLRGVNYWTLDNMDGTSTRVYLLGNMTVWWLVAFAAFVFVSYLLVFVAQLLDTTWDAEKDFLRVAGYCFAGWFLNYLPFVTVSRHTFLYHYIPALLYGILLIAAILDRMEYSGCHRRFILELLVILTIACFVFLAPNVYAIPLTKEEIARRFWLKGWD